MKIFIATLMAFALVVCCAKAQAGYWSDADLAKAVAVADAHWPNSPCYGRENITWLKDSGGEIADSILDGNCRVLVFWEKVVQYAPLYESNHPMYTCVGRCTLPAVNPTSAERNRYLCAVLEHEFGHLSGITFHPGYKDKNGEEDIYHSPDPTSVMYAGIDLRNMPWDCRKAFPLTSAKVHARLRP